MGGKPWCLPKRHALQCCSLPLPNPGSPPVSWVSPPPSSSSLGLKALGCPQPKAHLAAALVSPRSLGRWELVRAQGALTASSSALLRHCWPLLSHGELFLQPPSWGVTGAPSTAGLGTSRALTWLLQTPPALPPPMTHN